MKKLLSICFLSVLLGLMSFSAKAQCGFWVENLQPDVLSAVANSGNADGTYALNHTLGSASGYLQGNYNGYFGNVQDDALVHNGGAVQLYELHICPCDEYAGKKVSIDWVLERKNADGEWVAVNGNLSQYAEFGIYTFYSQINSYTGECQSIKWLGGIVPDGYGYCNEAETYTLYDTIMGLPQCTTPTNYPGALTVEPVTQTGVPGTVLATLPTPASPMVNIYSQGFDYFYYDFLASTRNIVTIKWKQSGDYRLVMRVRERIGGTDWYNAQWGGNELAHIGGHQSCCGPVLMEDAIGYPVFDTLTMEICENADAVVLGGPAPETYAFHANIPDTTLLYGTFEGAGDCQYINIDTIQNVSFFVRHNPVPTADDATICRCAPFNFDSLYALVHPDLTDLTDNDTYQIKWKVGPFWFDNINIENLTVGEHTFTFKQVNTYNDTLDCESAPVTVTVTVDQIQAPNITPGQVEFCLETIDETTLVTAVSVPDPICATTTRWYTKAQGGLLVPASLIEGQGNNLSVNLIDYMPSVNKDTTLVFFATSYNEETDCESSPAYFMVQLHQTPVLVATPMDSMYCPGGDVEMEVSIENNPFDVDPMYRYMWYNGNSITPVDTNATANTYTKHLSNLCGVNYVTSVKVIDGNGCVSEPVEFHYFTGDTINPTVTPAQVEHFVEACEVTTDNAPIYTTLEDLIEAFDLEIEDNCDVELITLVGVTDEVVTTEYCNDSHKRTYTIKDACGNEATFVEIVTPRDEVAPEFTFDRPIRLMPVPAGDCTYDCPDSLTLINIIAQYVYDNCTDSAYLMQGIKFVWENTGLSPFGENGHDIFRVENHLTINATITDRCNNVTTEPVFFLDRPDPFYIEEGGVHALPPYICYGDTVILAFDSTYCVDDSIVGPFNPYSYHWISNRDDVAFSDQDDMVTEVTFSGYGYYEFQMVVTNANGCYDTSEVEFVYVRKNPVVEITPVPADVETPLCPTYGYLDIRADLVDPVDGQYLQPHSFVWWGESVNEASDADTSFIHIIPVYCDTLYTANVWAIDDKGCVATAQYQVRAKAKEPSLDIDMDEQTLAPQAPACALRVPNFKEDIVGSMIDDECYDFNIGIKYHQEAGVDTLVENLIINGWPYDWYVQYPAAGEQVYGDTIVLVTITNPCGAQMVDTIQLRKPADYITVEITNPIQNVCQFDLIEDGFVTFTAVASDANAEYAWTELNDDEVLSDEATFTLADTLMDAGNLFNIYYYLVSATDAQQCIAYDTAALIVYYQGDDIRTTIWDDDMCTADNGMVRVDTLPLLYTAILTGIDVEYGPVIKVNDVPFHEGTDWNSIYFDSLSSGWYQVTVINLFGCERETMVFVGEDPNDVTPAIVSVTPAQCNGENGLITVVEQGGFSYELYKEEPALGSQTATIWVKQANYEGVVTAGNYFVRKINNSTFCYRDTTFTVDIEEATFTFVTNITNRTSCSGTYTGLPTENNYSSNGVLEFPNTNLYYRVKKQNADGTWNLNWDYQGQTTITGLFDGFYAIEATDVNDCRAYDTVEIQDMRVYPQFTATPHANVSCTDDKNGSIDFTPTTGNRYYVNVNYIYEYSTMVPATTYYTTSINNLPAGTYIITAIAEGTYCRANDTVEVVDSLYYPVVEVDSIISNTSCDPERLAYNGGIVFNVTAEDNDEAIYNTYIKNYSIEIDSVVHSGELIFPVYVKTDADIAAHTHTVDGLDEHEYHWTVTSKYGCSVSGDTVVTHKHIPPMELAMIPNHYCGPMGTTKPGNGQVIILAPIAVDGDDSHFYEYKFFDSTYTQMEVPYDLPLTHTMYWMADGLYHVYAFDTVTGCEVEDSIYVELDVFEFELAITTTPSQFCDPEHGDGTAQVTIVNAENPDGDYLFSMDGVNFNNETGLFTNLAVGAYHFWAKDITTGCIREGDAVITDSLCQPRFFITDGTDTNVTFTYCIYDADVILTGWVETDCDNNFEYSWKAPCSNIDTSNTASILVDIDHVMPNGCTYIFHAYNPVTGCRYDTLINVSIHERPGFTFTINGCDVPTNVPNRYCEQENLLIAVVPMNNARITSYEWTQGWNGTDSSFNFLGADTNLNDLTFCVRITDQYNCASNIGSLPVSLNRVQTQNVNDTACSIITINNIEYGPVMNDSIFVVEEVIPGHWRQADDCEQNSACDIIRLHHVVLYSQPVVEFENVLAKFIDSTICAPYGNIVAEIRDSVIANITPQSTSSYTVTMYVERNGEYFMIADPIGYDDNNLMVVVAPNNNYCDTLSYPFELTLGKAPIIDSFMLANPYCNLGEDVELTVIVTNRNPEEATVTLTLPDATVLTETVAPRTDSAYVTFSFVPWNTTYNVDNDSLVKLYVENACGLVKDSLKIAVDTTLPRHIEDVTLCEGDTLYFAYFPGIGGYEVSEGMLQNANGIFVPVDDSTYVLTDTTAIFFFLTNSCGNIFRTDTAIINVKPLPKIDADFIDHWDLCLANAVEDLDNLVIVTDAEASLSGWVLVDELGVRTEPMTTAQLVDSIKKVHDADVYYYAANLNGCGDSLKFIGNIRILMPLEVTAPTITICPNNVTYSNIVDHANPYTVFSHNNYDLNEVGATYWYQYDGINWTQIPASPAPLPLESGDSIKIVYAPTIDPDCGSDYDYIHVNFYDTTYNEPTMDTACIGSPFSDFVDVDPEWTGSDIVLLDGAYWTVYNWESAEYVRFDNMDTMFVYGPNSPVFVQYVWNTLCGVYTTDVYELKFYGQPTVNIESEFLSPGEQYDTLAVCLNTMLSDLDIVANVNDPNNPSIVADTTWYLGGEEIDMTQDHQFTLADNNKFLVVEITTVCEPAYDTVVVIVNTPPVPKAQGDDIICTTGSATLSVVEPNNAYTYYWILNATGDTVSQNQEVEVFFTDLQNGSEMISAYPNFETTIDQAEFYYFTLVAVDENGCVSTSMINESNDAYYEDVISIKSTNAPQFIFKYEGNETHRIEGLTTGNQTNYTWQINNDCTSGDVLVFVEYTIYHNDTVINSELLANYFTPQTHNTKDWITRNYITWLSSSPQMAPQSATGYYYSAIPGFEDAYTGAQSGNHFPNQDMAFGNAQQYDDVFMHYLSNREVTKTIAPFNINGEYKIVYRLIATSFQNTYQHNYFNEDSAANLRIGGHMAYSGQLDTLAIDSIYLIVGGDNLAAVENPVTPNMAPAITTNETVIAPEMEVWPNPAPAIVTTFKARVHNMSGDATVTITNFSGKQVYSGKLFIDSDDYYFEADVNSLAVGAYIMTVRTQDAVVTKKLVVTVRQ